MLTKIYQIRFPSLTQSKVGASYVSERLGAAIADYNIAGLSILLCKDGHLHVHVRFDTVEELKAFDPMGTDLINELKGSLTCTDERHSAVNVFTFEREAFGI